MNDIIAIFHREHGYTVEFCIDGRWYPQEWPDGQRRHWFDEEGARQFLRDVARRYEAAYGESLGWDVESIPVKR